MPPHCHWWAAPRNNSPSPAATTAPPWAALASVLGTANWYYYQEADKLPLPITLSKDLRGSDLAYYNDFYFLPNEDNRETYHVIDYKGNGGSITIPSTVNNKPVTRIDSDVLQGNRTITSVTISENITGIGHRTFEGCTALKTLTINSSSPLHIGSMAFAGCTALTTINFYCGNFDYTYTDNEGVTDGGYAFSNCTNLKTLDFRGKANPLDGLKGKSAFSGCTNITDISAYTDYLRVLTAGIQNKKVGIVSKNGSTLHMVIPDASTYYGDEEGQFEIPTSISALAPGALDDTPWLTELTASSLTTISAPSFQNCDNLKFIDFSACSYLDNITVDRTAAGTPFYGVDDKTFIYLPSSSNAAKGQKNVVIGNTGTELLLTEGMDFDPKVAFSFTTATYDRSFTAYATTEGYEDRGYTICLPFAWTLKLDENSEAKVYSPTKIEDVEGVTTVTFSEVQGGQMAAFTPYYIVVSTGGATINGQGGSVEQHQTAGSAVIDDASYQFKGSTVTIPNSTLYDTQKPAYILQSDGWWHKVPQNQPLAYVGPFRAYFQATDGNANTRSLAMMFSGNYNPDEGSGANAIEPVVRTIDNDGTEHYFDLNGRLLNDKPQKGIYIQNGKNILTNN